MLIKSVSNFKYVQLSSGAPFCVLSTMVLMIILLQSDHLSRKLNLGTHIPPIHPRSLSTSHMTQSCDFLAVWCNGNALVLINAVALHRARLVLGWVTAFG